MLASLILYLKGMRTTMFQLSGFYCTCDLQFGLESGFEISASFFSKLPTQPGLSLRVYVPIPYGDSFGPTVPI